MGTFTVVFECKTVMWVVAYSIEVKVEKNYKLCKKINVDTIVCHSNYKILTI